MATDTFRMKLPENANGWDWICLSADERLNFVWGHLLRRPEGYYGDRVPHSITDALDRYFSIEATMPHRVRYVLEQMFHFERVTGVIGRGAGCYVEVMQHAYQFWHAYPGRILAAWQRGESSTEIKSKVAWLRRLRVIP